MAAARTYKYDVALSCAEENREYVASVAAYLTDNNVTVFLDTSETASLWGTDLTIRLTEIYGVESRFVVPFISKEYAAKRWPRQELRAALARAVDEEGTYILPVRFDETKLPGLLPTVAYLDATRLTPSDIAKHIAAKLALASRPAEIATAPAPIPGTRSAPFPPFLSLDRVLKALPLSAFGHNDHRDNTLSGPFVGAVFVALATSFVLTSTRHATFFRDLNVLLSWACGACTLVGLFSYLETYYKEIYAEFYALPGDRLFYRVYAGLIVIALVGVLPIIPMLWFLPVTVLYAILYVRKRQVTRQYEIAFVMRYARVDLCDVPLDRARLSLCRAFTHLWLRNAVLPMTTFSILLFGPASRPIPEQAVPLQLSVGVQWSAAIVIITLVIWVRKIRSDIAHIRTRLVSGDHAYFDHMDF